MKEEAIKKITEGNLREYADILLEDIEYESHQRWIIETPEDEIEEYARWVKERRMPFPEMEKESDL